MSNPTDDTPEVQTSAPGREPDVLLVLRPLRDPLERPGQPARDSDYRLKLVLKRLLRDFGFRCLRACDVKPGTKPADVKVEEPKGGTP